MRIHQFGDAGELKYDSAPDPAPRPDEVLIRVRACALNYLDVKVRRGEYPRSPLPLILGSDIAGEIVATGSAATGLAPGQRVVSMPSTSCMHCPECLAGRHNNCPEHGYLGVVRNGGYAELVTAPAVGVFPIPDSLNFVAGAAVPLVFVTAWQMVVARGGVRAGQNVLIWGAGSGVGTAAIQVARLHGARVLAAVSGEQRGQQARALGADVVIDPAIQDVVAAVQSHTDGGAHLVIDTQGADTLAPSLQAMAVGGRYVSVAVTAGHAAQLDFGLLLKRQATVMGSRGGPKSNLSTVLAHVAAGRLAPVIQATYPLAEAAAAHRAMEARGLFGKLVLTA